jgi:hypothetical protein
VELVLPIPEVLGSNFGLCRKNDTVNSCMFKTGYKFLKISDVNS